MKVTTTAATGLALMPMSADVFQLDARGMSPFRESGSRQRIGNAPIVEPERVSRLL
jgi:hypothetical protein